MEKVLLIGGRRGLGAAVARAWRARHPTHEMLLTSRKPFDEAGSLVCDLAQGSDVDKLVHAMKEWGPHRVFCFAGGGPYGAFQTKEWKDHHWALQVSLMAPMRLLLESLRLSSCGQVILVGSAIAEAQPDTNAASYAAAKHGLVGLVSSVKQENPQQDVRLFSPGYMDTDMLPPQAAARRHPEALLEVDDVAAEFVEWALDPQASWHRICRP